MQVDFVEVTSGRSLIFELGSRGDSLESILRVKNISKQVVAVRIKTKKDQSFSVKPPLDVLNPKEEKSILFKTREPKPNVDGAKFLLQAIAAHGDWSFFSFDEANQSFRDAIEEGRECQNVRLVAQLEDSKENPSPIKDRSRFTDRSMVTAVDKSFFKKKTAAQAEVVDDGLFKVTSKEESITRSLSSPFMVDYRRKLEQATSKLEAQEKFIEDVSKVKDGLSEELEPVSYTHLTLPTIYSV
eukprot:TRINITY_DN13840_c0_g1_i1.p1 TRINITY_DN13840_c0_g1~~TRINITY_DN13840_c0_g1_i1.p1  ORF type:complete len:242 (-),score=45.25 TRINITY_DN13840_c0_g1_i1:34-759(-)